MLVLSRRSGEGLSLAFPDGTVVRLFVEPSGQGKVKCVIDAPKHVRVDRLADTGKRTKRNRRNGAGWITKSITR